MYKSNKYTILDHLLVQYHYTTILFNFGQFKFSLELLKEYEKIDKFMLCPRLLGVKYSQNQKNNV